MSTQDIVARILSDATAEADDIVKSAQAKAQKIIEDATLYAENSRKEAEADVEARVESILGKRSADARLESAKILLEEKRKTLDAVYALALQRLIALDKEQTLKLFSTLLEAYAEEGDTVCFAESFKYEADIAILPVVAKKGLTLSQERLPIDGGMRLSGVKSDKDLSYAALLSADKDAYLAQIAKTLFKA